MSRAGPRDWHEICEEISKEENSDRFSILLQELLDALEERERERGPSRASNPLKFDATR